MLSSLIGDLAKASPAGLQAALMVRGSMREKGDAVGAVGSSGILTGIYQLGLLR
jgi:hypothetical protein